MLSPTQQRLLKLRRGALWTFAGLALFTCALWVVSLWGVNWCRPFGINVDVSAWYGCLNAHGYRLSGESALASAGFDDRMYWWPDSSSELVDIDFYDRSFIFWSVSLPFWLILSFFLLCFTTTLFVCRRTLHRLHHRLCMKCGYDLASLPRTDHCPECGHTRTFRFPK